MIVIIDYGMGNLRSVLKKFERLKIEAIISSDKNKIYNASKLILPGVGYFAQGINNIKKAGFLEILNEKVLTLKTPILGICLGMQLFARSSQEGNCKGLDWLNADVLKFSFSDKIEPLRIPHVGWNTINIVKKSPLLNGIKNNTRFYFTHSYYLNVDNQDDNIAVANYGIDFSAVVNQGNIYGTQFHPEKSHQAGLKLIKNFSELL